MARYNTSYTANGEVRLYFESEPGEGYDDFRSRCVRDIAAYERENRGVRGSARLDDTHEGTTRYIWYR